MIRTRFAPSPTGFLHVGGPAPPSTHGFSPAKADPPAEGKRGGGKFVLRIEDTDQVRSTAESAAGILQDLLWLGLSWDEGPVVGGARK